MTLKEYLISEYMKQFFKKIDNLEDLTVDGLKDNESVINYGAKIKLIVEGLCEGAEVDPNLEYSPNSEQMVSDLLIKVLTNK